MANADLLTSTEAGAILGKSGRTVQRMVIAGDLPTAGKLPGPNGAYLIRRADVLRLAASLADPEPTEAAS